MACTFGTTRVAILFAGMSCTDCGHDRKQFEIERENGRDYNVMEDKLGSGRDMARQN